MVLKVAGENTRTGHHHLRLLVNRITQKLLKECLTKLGGRMEPGKDILGVDPCKRAEQGFFFNMGNNR